MRDTSAGRRALLQLKKRLRLGDPTASSNIAATYREQGNTRRALHWWRRAADSGDGDAWFELGYCLQYGIGARRDPVAAIVAYQNAIKSSWATEFGIEEAQYHLAVALLDRGTPRFRREAQRLLAVAAGDHDYPQADQLLGELGHAPPWRICRCRRELARRLGGRAQCVIHRGW